MRLASPPDPLSTHIEVFANGARCEFREVRGRGWYSCAFDMFGQPYGRRVIWLPYGRTLPSGAVPITDDMRSA